MELSGASMQSQAFALAVEVSLQKKQMDAAAAEAAQLLEMLPDPAAMAAQPLPKGTYLDVFA